MALHPTAKFFTILILSIIGVIHANAQSTKIFRAAVIQDGTKEKVQDAIVENLRTGLAKRTDNFGVFEILSAIGDSLIIHKIGYQDTYYRVANYNDARIYIKLSNQLLEVKIQAGRKASKNFEEASYAYAKQRGILYEGKPPLALLSPFGGSPITFFYELFSKDAKRVRRLNSLAAKALIDEEIAVRFNRLTIKAAVPIKDEEVDVFIDNYSPKVEDLRKWSDFQLMQYIMESFERYKKKQ
ncbi:MAG: hypothetical protein EOP48_06825 [Sphingobacteriales bacterium]|nr:MAG: hypothetical protein EOP48_06825 [Sphingobacteriales bacterium]